MTHPSSAHPRRAPVANDLASLPHEVQINILTFLRADDLGQVQQTSRHFHNPDLVHQTVTFFAEHVYESIDTRAFFQEIRPKGFTEGDTQQYNYQHLRHLELYVIARCLNSPEPATGYVVSKSWCKTALKWLEIQHHEPPHRTSTTTASAAASKKKLSKKQLRLRHRKLSDVATPWPNVNADILCEHQQLQRCSNTKTARARRRIMDKQAWKILKRLYPDSIQLESHVGECLHCTLEFETLRRHEQDRLEQEKLRRKQPLSDPDVRRFYTRRTGVPAQALDPRNHHQLVPGKYFILPRSWCHQWRKYIKTGEGGLCPPPDAASLLCHAHRRFLVPPHLEAYLTGKSVGLWSGAYDTGHPTTVAAVDGSIAAAAVDPETMHLAVQVAGLSVQEVSQQLNALRHLETNNTAAPLGVICAPTRNEVLDHENHDVIEILTCPEMRALERCWSQTSFLISLQIEDSKASSPAPSVTYSTPCCFDCDATGRQYELRLKHRARGNTKRAPSQPNLEY